jgi:6-phospho-beta-glucosidase
LKSKKSGALPEEARGLVQAERSYERAAIEAAVTGSELVTRKAMLLYPSVGEWEPSAHILRDLACLSPAFSQLL